METNRELTASQKLLVKLSFSVIIFIIVLTVVPFYWRHHREYIQSYGKLTIGEVETSGTKIIVRFKTKNGGFTSKRKTRHYKGIQTGEKFMVKYLEEKPYNFLILYDKPVIDEQLFKNTSSLDVRFKNEFVIFTYQVGKNVYRKIQDTGLKNPEVLHGQEDISYLVKYKVDNPLISYIYLDTILASARL